MSWQELGHSTWGRFSGHRLFHYRKRFAYPERVLLNSERHNPLWKQSQKNPSLCLCAWIKRVLQRSQPPWPSCPLPHNAASVFCHPSPSVQTLSFKKKQKQILLSGCLCSVYETAIVGSVSGSSGMEDGARRAASCFDGSRLPLRW